MRWFQLRASEAGFNQPGFIFNDVSSFITNLVDIVGSFRDRAADFRH